MIKRIVITLSCAFVLTNTNAQFSIDIGYNFLHLYADDRPVYKNTKDKHRNGISGLTGSYNLTYTHKRINVSVGTQRFYFAFRNENGIADHLDPIDLKLESNYFNTHYNLVKKEKLRWSMGLGYYFKHELTYSYLVYFPEIQLFPRIASVVDNYKKIAILSHLEYAPTEFTVFRLKINYLMPLSKMVANTHQYSAYLIYQLSYGLYL